MLNTLLISHKWLHEIHAPPQILNHDAEESEKQKSGQKWKQYQVFDWSPQVIFSSTHWSIHDLHLNFQFRCKSHKHHQLFGYTTVWTILYRCFVIKHIDRQAGFLQVHA